MSTQPPACVLAISGSDPSGGAGLQADLKVIARTGAYGAAAVTAVTVQNSLGVSRVDPVAPDLVAEQVRAVLTGMGVAAVKTGMMGCGEVAEAVAETLAGFTGEVVCDPVLRATSGADLSRDPDLAATRALIAAATVVTPNRGELALLAGSEITNGQEAAAAADRLFIEFPRLAAVVIKGGHFNEDATVCDRLMLRDEHGAQEAALHQRPRLPSSPHGTGCALAAALAGFLAQDWGMVPAFTRAASLLDELLGRTFTPRPGGAAYMRFT